MDEAFAEREEAYKSIQNNQLGGKESLVECLKSYRDSLLESVESIRESLG